MAERRRRNPPPPAGENPPAAAGESQPQAEGAHRVTGRATEEMAFDTVFQLLSELVLTPAFDAAQTNAPRTYQEVIWYAKVHPYAARVLTMIVAWLLTVLGGRVNLRRFAGHRASELTDAALGQLPAAMAQFLAQRADAGVPAHRPTFLELPILIGRLFAGVRDDEALPFALPGLPDWLQELLHGWEVGRAESMFLQLDNTVAARLAALLFSLPPEKQAKGRRVLFGGTYDAAALEDISRTPRALFFDYIERIEPDRPADVARGILDRTFRGAEIAMHLHRGIGERLGPDTEYEHLRNVSRRGLVRRLWAALRNE